MTLILKKGLRFRRGYIPTPWTPAQISTAIWLDAADSSTITTVSGAVSQWNDKSGNARHISQSTASARPALASNTFNGLPALAFDGTNDVLLNPTVGADNLSNLTIISVFRQDTGDGSEDFQFAIGQTGASGKVRGFYRASGFGPVLVFQGWGLIATSTLQLDIGGSHHIFGFRNNALSGTGSMTFLRDGTAQARTIEGALSTTTDGFSVGSIQGASIGAYYSAITVAEIVVFYVAVGDATIRQVEGYLAHKWGLTANLPNDHPFKVNPPYV